MSSPLTVLALLWLLAVGDFPNKNTFTSQALHKLLELQRTLKKLFMFLFEMPYLLYKYSQLAKYIFKNRAAISYKESKISPITQPTDVLREAIKKKQKKQLNAGITRKGGGGSTLARKFLEHFFNELNIWALPNNLEHF